METKELLKRISVLAKRNTAVTAEIQTLGLACLQHGASEAQGGFGDVMPLNRLVLALSRSQTRAFVEWALAFGMVQRNMAADSKAVMPLRFDGSRTLDIAGATEKTWDEFAPAKAESIAKAFDLQAAVMKVLKQAAEAGKPQSIIDALADAAGIDKASRPKVVAAPADAAPALI